MIEGGTLALMLRMVVSLAIVLSLVVLFARYMERRGSGRAGGRRGRRGRSRASLPGVDVDVLARTHLARGVSVQVVRVGAQVLALGVTETSVRVLTDLGAADLVPEADADDAAGDGPGPATPAGAAAASRDLFEQLLRREGRHRVAPQDDVVDHHA